VPGEPIRQAQSALQVIGEPVQRQMFADELLPEQSTLIPK